MAGTCSMLCLILVTLFIPPLGVFLISGCSADFFINILLTILGYASLLTQSLVFSAEYTMTSMAMSPPICTITFNSMSTAQLTQNRYLPGHIHAFYLEYVYYRQRDGATGRAPGVYSERIQRGGHHETTYGAIQN
ncbi:hypothetical protein ABOM_006168 [Aspergillus bombycis]|uniref:Stress response RCI peptide n=1 Tax=Aspergillus bombycis TaxID=109264 RepID=A0A1F7ZZD6_9EURO|nr:hypothetical protein ABOM_006168 [Aspergillus bombycis]OGM44811.1 hypothetical protein ABOM_006168 [Aspergillus bombycis]